MSTTRTSTLPTWSSFLIPQRWPMGRRGRCSCLEVPGAGTAALSQSGSRLARLIGSTEPLDRANLRALIDAAG
jgi:hypothetical protein